MQSAAEMWRIRETACQNSHGSRLPPLTHDCPGRHWLRDINNYPDGKNHEAVAVGVPNDTERQRAGPVQAR